MNRRLMVGLLAAGLSLQGDVALAAAEFKIVTASARGTYIQIGRDIASLVASPVDIELEVLPSAGSAKNVRRLRYEPGVKFAIVQSDVYQAFLDQAAGGNVEANKIIRPLRVIMPLYNGHGDTWLHRCKNKGEIPVRKGVLAARANTWIVRVSLQSRSAHDLRTPRHFHSPVAEVIRAYFFGEVRAWQPACELARRSQ